MTTLMTLPMAGPVRKPDTRELLPLDDYDLIIASFSGGKDSMALVLHLLELGVNPDRIQLWHQCVDGENGEENPFMDWPCTHSYVLRVGQATGIRTLFQYRLGGFEAEMCKENARSLPVRFERQDGTWGEAGGLKGKISTRRRYPQKTADLSVRYCSPIIKIDVATLAINNDPALRSAKLLFLTGERREEGRNGKGRAAYAEREPHRCDGQRRRVDAWRAVIDWDEQAVWDIIARWGIVPHPAYRLGFPRVSCMCCIFGLADQWASVRKIAPAYFERVADYEEEFGCTITQGMTVRQMADRGTPYPECEDEALVSLAMSHSYPAREIVLPDGVEWTMPAGAFKRGGGPT